MGKSQGREKVKLSTRLRNKFRLVIMNDETLEEKASLLLSPINVVVIAGIIIIALITATTYIIAFTPLREYIPGYTDVKIKRAAIESLLRTDSLQKQVAAQALYIENLKNLITGQSQKTVSIDTVSIPQLYDTIRQLYRSPEDSMLRAEMESPMDYNLALNAGSSRGSIANFSFFTPLKGAITTRFNPTEKHFGVDVVAGPDAVIKSALDGTVVMADWTSQSGYVIAIQHSNNLFSVYKHNSALLKKVGNVVKAGEVIAIVGNSGELSNGPHLHFELWYNGAAVNPTDYMAFE
jgi:murein DD-endopeptidase MepM/ murein hydrolase activator NlpD